MAKLKTLFNCQQCGYQSPKWLGRCPDCESWNSLVEELIATETPSQATAVADIPTLLSAIPTEDSPRLSTGVSEFDRVLGGGMVAGSVTLVGGEPGIGKSTLLLGVAGAVAAQGHEVLYVSGEESLRQTKLRAIRLGLAESTLKLVAQTQLESIQKTLSKEKPQLVILDSIQVMEMAALDSAPGSIGQVRACAHALVHQVKQTRTALMIVGHVTKEGAIAGPKVLEHLVDTVLNFEGDSMSGFRLLRSSKNRFGATHELGVFHMATEGLIEVTNPSELFLSERKSAVAGCMVTVSMEGSRPILAEIQALTSPSGVGMPRRRTTGVDGKRLSMLLAVLERRVGLRQLAQQDVFVSTLGGMRVHEPGADLGIALAVASSLQEVPIPRHVAAIGEVGLTGEVRPVMNIEQRIFEAKRVGFSQCLVAKGRGMPKSDSEIELIPVTHVSEAVKRVLKG